ncbi:focadhesin isoform X3 [Triplophysa dalaica]|uniref:focadhesin isoform X3 n=1 Tax=Triplophysa dalaica TaxID=1582913 RepID=UPI0024E026B5|nr:focadhesin isoform X3 [Triplophysa dalaica]
MTENLKTRFGFPSTLIQAQAVRSLVTSVLKEKGLNEKISQTSTKGRALETLWDQCSSDDTFVRSACCDALLLIVDQEHADLQYVLNTTLNLLPSARNVQGLIKVVGRLLQIQASRRDNGVNFTCPYSIRSFPHPYITIMENRPDCWPALLQEIDDFIQLAADRDEPVFVEMLVPFLRYLYCEPQRLSENALLRHSLLRVLLQPRGASQSDSQLGKGPTGTRVGRELIRSLFDLFPYMLVDSVTALVEFGCFVESLSSALLTDPSVWKKELPQLALQLLCACHLSVQLGGELMSLLHTLHQLIPAYAEELPFEQVIMGISLLLLRASTSQQTAILELAVKIVPPEISPPPGSSVLVMPLLQVLSCLTLMEALTDGEKHTKTIKLANSLLQTIQREPSVQKEKSTQLSLPLSTWYSDLQVATSVLHRISKDSMCAVEWLYSLQSSLSVCEHVPNAVCLLISHLIVSSDGDICRLALDTAAAIAETDPAKVPCLLPVLMFKLDRVSDPALSHSVLYTMPRLGTHKFCIPQVLHVLQTLGSSPRLRPMALRLLVLLWKKQDRVYPDLQRLMSQLDSSSVVMGRDTQWEQILARAACVRDICRERPYQHGGDMLSAITETLTQFFRKDQAFPAALTLQGLKELCRTEVVDIMSTWRALSPKLCCDTRPMILKATADLLSLVPALNVKTEEYEKFKSETVSVLWGYALSQDPEVASHGFKALSEYPETSHTILHLPEQARPVPNQSDNEGERKDNENNDEKDECISVPGSSYVKLLRFTPQTVLPALETFLTALARQEMNQMPRGVYHSALSGGTLRSDQGKTVAGIPLFMLKTYEKNKQPGLKPGLAAGLLFSYDLPVQSDKDGRPITRFLVSRGRSYQQMLATLIHEVNIQPSEWHRSLLLPQAWRGFMSRTYHALIQGRKAELAMLQTHGKENPEELQYKQHWAWLWVRDQLTDVVKSATKDSPVVQGNSILALSGLAVVLTRYESNLPTQSESGFEVGPDILPTTHWLSMVIDTLLSIVSSNSNSKGQIFPWFIHGKCESEQSSQQRSRLNEVIRAITQIITFSGTIGLQSNGACLLGHLHLANMCSGHSRIAVPQEFGYLTEKSVIRACVDFIIEAGRKGPEFNPPHFVKTAMAALATVGANVQFPPINWNAVLSPLMRLSFGEEVQHHCLELASIQAQTSQSASIFLSIWIVPPLVHSLSLRTRAYLYECLCCWMKHVAEEKLQVYLDCLAVQQFEADTRPHRMPLCLSILRGLSKALAVPNPPQSCWSSLCSTTEKIYNQLPDKIQAGEGDLYEEICLCLFELSDTEIDRLVNVTEANLEKTTFILSYLTSKGRVPLLGLNDVISTILQVGNKERISWLLLQALHQSRFASSANTGVSKRMEWLLELMGHIRNVAYGSPSVKCVNVIEGTDFLLNVFAAAVVSWADHCAPLLVGIRAQWFPWRQSSQKLGLVSDLFVSPASTELSVASCLIGIPSSIKKLLAKEPWKSQLQKFIDWLFSIIEHPGKGFSKTAICIAKASLMALRTTPEFKKKVVWTRAYGW